MDYEEPQTQESIDQATLEEDIKYMSACLYKQMVFSLWNKGTCVGLAQAKEYAMEWNKGTCVGLAQAKEYAMEAARVFYE